MSAAELQRFIDQWNAKLKILLRPDTGETREWLGQYMSAMATGYRRKFIHSLGDTDVANVTAGQIEQALNRLRLQKLSAQQQESSYATFQRQMAQTHLESSAAQRAARQAAAVQPTYQQPAPAYQSPYSTLPSSQVLPPATQREASMTLPYGRGFVFP